MKFAVSEDGVSALKTLSGNITGAIVEVYQLTANIQAAMDEHSDAIGPHRASLNEAIKNIYQSVKTSAEPVNTLSETLKEVAEAYQEIIDNDRIGTQGGQQKGGMGYSGVASGGTLGGASAGNTAAKQTRHSPYISTYKEQVVAVQDDVRRGSGRNISEEEARKMLYGIHSFSGTASTRIRSAYNNPNADSKDAQLMRSVDDYINSSPKWEGKVYRGINVTNEQENKILSGNPIDMLGPSSWSSERSVAERFSNGYKDVRIVFVLDNNKSGASITHIGSWDGIESEVTAPSGVKYQFDGVKRVKDSDSEIIFINVHE